MRVAELIRHLNDTYAISVYVDNGKLKTRSASAELDPAAADLIRANRDALIRFLDAAGDVRESVAQPIPVRRDRSAPAPLSFASTASVRPSRICIEGADDEPPRHGRRLGKPASARHHDGHRAGQAGRFR